MNKQIIAYSKPEHIKENRSHSHPSKICQKFSDQRTVRSAASSSATRSQQWEEFQKFYRDRRLTDCLEILEKQGFSGDSAIFILTLVGAEG